MALSAGLAKLEIPLGGDLEIGFSSLLVCMMCGTVFCNLCDFSEEIMYKTDKWTAPVNVLFFVLSGASWTCGCSATWPLWALALLTSWPGPPVKFWVPLTAPG